jgi:hypothetical protein
VMAACHPLCIDALGVGMQAAKLEPVIAADAGVWCAACVVLIFKVSNNLLELIGKVEGVEGDVQYGGDASGIMRVGDGAAAFVPKGRASNGFARGTKPHKAANNVITRLNEEGCGNAGIDAA